MAKWFNEFKEVYKAIKSVLNNLAPSENAPTAARAYTVGDFIEVGGTIYKVIEPITAGDTLIYQTNYDDIPTGGLNELKSAIGESEWIDITNQFDLTQVTVTKAGSVSNATLNTGNCYIKRNGGLLLVKATITVTKTANAYGVGRVTFNMPTGLQATNLVRDPFLHIKTDGTIDYSARVTGNVSTIIAEIEAYSNNTDTSITAYPIAVLFVV